MQSLRVLLLEESMIPHCCPMDQQEVQKLMYLPEIYMQQLRSNEDDDMDMFECFKTY